LKIYRWRNYKVGFIFSLFVFNILPLAHTEEAPHTLEPIVVTATRIPRESPYLLRSVSVIDAEAIEEAPVHSVPELLGYALSVDPRRRGSYGVQADMSIRGSSFEQVLILIDGIKVNDPQTGHHNMDIPLTLMDIERIEVLRGHGSSLYGPNAFGGVINIITKPPKGKGVELELWGGEHSLSGQALSISYPLGKFNNRLSFERRESSAYPQDTEFDITTFSFSSAMEAPFGLVDLSFGVSFKDFGADSFYSASYPHEEEHTDTRFFRVGAKLGGEKFSIEPKLYYRRHWDKFALDRNDPSWNVHTTYLYGAELLTRLSSTFGSIVVGGELGDEEITSTMLGDYSRTRGAVYLELEPELGRKLMVNLGMRGDYYSDWDWQGCPTLNVGYRLSPLLKLRSSVGRSFRVPSYTELYYLDPANIGDPTLKQERAWSYEAGLDYQNGGIYCGTTLFWREGRNIIDWMRSDPTAEWKAGVIREVDTSGLEATIEIRPREFKERLPISLISLNYTYMDSDTEDSVVYSKYVLCHLKHQICFGLQHFLPFGVQQVWKLAYEDRVQGEEYWSLDTRVSKKIMEGKQDVELFVEVTNLFNTSYEEAVGVPMPGRWIQAGMRMRF